MNDELGPDDTLPDDAYFDTIVEMASLDLAAEPPNAPGSAAAPKTRAHDDPE